MTVQRFNPVATAAISLSDQGEYVKYADYEKLAAKLSMINGLMDAAEQANKIAQEATEKLVQERDALAAENAALKSFISQSCYSYDGDGSDVCDSYVNADESPLFPKTPATEAFLAEVRAQGVEMLNTQFKKCTGMLYADSVVSTAEHFAAQLRKGVQS